MAIGLRLKLSTSYGIALATKTTTTFIMNPTIPEAVELQDWCRANTLAIKELALARNVPSEIPKGTRPSEGKIVKICNLPASVTKAEFMSVKGMTRVTSYDQNFFYLSCSICNKATDAYGDDDFWCNYCVERVASVPRTKFEVEITDGTGSITATIFEREVEDVFHMTATEFKADAINGRPSLKTMQVLSTNKLCEVNLKAYKYDSGGISQCKFNITSIFDASTFHQKNQEVLSLPLPPVTPNKKPRSESYKRDGIAIETTPNEDMEDTLMKETAKPQKNTTKSKREN